MIPPWFILLHFNQNFTWFTVNLQIFKSMNGTPVLSSGVNLTTSIFTRSILKLFRQPICFYRQAQKYLAEELQSIQNSGLGIIAIPRTSRPTLEDRCNIAPKRELERIVNDINHPNRIFLTKPNTSHGYNLRSKPGSVAIPKSGTQRHTNSFIARAARLLL